MSTRGRTPARHALRLRAIRRRDVGISISLAGEGLLHPRGTPNIIATAYAIRALDQCAPLLSLDVDPIIADTARFVATELVRKAVGKNRRYLAYATGSDAMVHNASLWGAYVLALAAQRGGPKEWGELAEAAIEYSLRAQSPDGAWVYGWKRCTFAASC